MTNYSFACCRHWLAPVINGPFTRRSEAASIIFNICWGLELGPLAPSFFLSTTTRRSTFLVSFLYSTWFLFFIRRIKMSNKSPNSLPRWVYTLSSAHRTWTEVCQQINKRSIRTDVAAWYIVHWDTRHWEILFYFSQKEKRVKQKSKSAPYEMGYKNWPWLFLKEGADLTTAEIAVRRGNQHCAALSPVFVCGDGGGCTYRPRAIEIRLWLDYVLAFI